MSAGMGNSYPHSAGRKTVFHLGGKPRDTHVYPAGVELFAQGENPNEVYFVHAGLLMLSRVESNGRRILIDLMFPGSLLGSAAAIRSMPQPTTVVTATSCRLSRWRSEEFVSLVAQDASLSYRVLEMLSTDVLDHISRISQLTCLPARQRLEQFLWQLCERLGPDDIVQRAESAAKLQLPLKHYEIAELLSITPTYLCRLLNALEMESVITRSKGWIMVSKPSELWHVETL